MHSQNYVQHLLLSLNYYLLIWLLIAYKRDEYSSYFIILLTFIIIERVLMIIRVIIVSLVKNGGQTILVPILLTLFYIDYTIGNNSSNGGFDYDSLISNLNYTIHFINFLPMIFNLMIIQNALIDHNPIYLASIIYGFIHMSLVDYFLYHNDTVQMGIIKAIYRIVMNLSKKLCFYLLIADLIENNLGFISILPLYVIFDIIIFIKGILEGYPLSTLLQIQIITSLEIMEDKTFNTQAYLLQNSFQSIMLAILFLVRMILIQDSSRYNILIYISFVISLFDILMSQYNIFLFYTKGPFTFEIKKSLFSYNSKQIISNLITTIEKKILAKYLKIGMIIDESSDFVIKDIQAFIQFILLKDTQQFSLIFSSQRSKQKLIEVRKISNRFNLQFLTSIGETQTLFIKLILKNLQDKKYDYLVRDQLYYQQNNRKFLFCYFQCSKQSDNYFIMKQIIEEINFYTPKQFIFHQAINTSVFNDLFSQILPLIVFYKDIKELVPLNVNSLLYDLQD